MPIRRFRPITPGRRFMASPDYSEITKGKPEKSLVEPKRRKAGRNNTGKMTIRNRGGGNKRMYRIIDFKRSKDDVGATVLAIEYDPIRSARLALLQYKDGEKRYIIAPNGIQVGATIVSGPNAARLGRSLRREHT